MATNPYFNKTTFVTEQSLIQDLIDEAIQIHGLDTYYLVREDVDMDTLFGEDELARFEMAIPIEMYIKNISSFQGQSEFMSKFGLQIEDQCTFSVSVRRFANAVNTANSSISRPREGDIVWLQMTPTNRYLFEIRFVEDKEQLFQLGKLYTWEIRCELMNYSHERVQTGNTAIDGVSEAKAFTLELELSGLVQPDANITYIHGETVYQGDPSDPTASGTALSYDANTSILSVQNITGIFSSDGGVVTGTDSGTTGTLVDSPSVLPEVHDPIADNELLQDESEGIIVIRGSNPIRS